MKATRVTRVALAGVLACVCPADIVYVDDDAPPGGDGTSWDNAWMFLQDALRLAASGDEIRVAQGTYRPDRDATFPNGTGDRSAGFELQGGVTCLGGYAGRGAPDPNERDIALYETILSGDLLGDDGPDFSNNGDNSFHVVVDAGTQAGAVVDGFAITAGNANASSGMHRRGGGLYVLGSPTLRNCVVARNKALLGAGLYISGSGLIVENCAFDGNYTDYWGGGLYIGQGEATLTGCTFAANSANRGGGIHYDSGQLALTNCLLIVNSAWEGGAIFGQGNGVLTCTGCSFRGNWATGAGGLRTESATATLNRCVFAGNAAHDAGAIYGHGPLLIVACLFIGNASDYHGGAIESSASGLTVYGCAFGGNTAVAGGGALDCENATVSRCVIHGNSASGYGAGVAVANGTLSNCILWANYPEQVFVYAANPAITYSDIENGWPGVGNIAADPSFVPGPQGTWTADPTYDPNRYQITFFDDNASWATNSLAGKNVNANLGQWLHWLIVENTATTITVWADRATITAGSPFVAAGMNYRVHDYHLNAGSPCIDAGDNTYPLRDVLDLDGDGCVTDPMPVDLDGNACYFDDLNSQDSGHGVAPIVDIGAYEFASTPAWPAGPCPGDLDCDGDVDFDDIDPLVLALSDPAFYQQQYPDCNILNADCNNDGLVDFDDINPFVELLSGT